MWWLLLLLGMVYLFKCSNYGFEIALTQFQLSLLYHQVKPDLQEAIGSGPGRTGSEVSQAPYNY